MVVIMKPDFTPEQLEEAIRAMEAGGVKVKVSKGSETTILGAEGDAGRRSGDAVAAARRGAGDAGQRALQEGQPQVPPGRHGDRPGRRGRSGREKAGRHRRTLLGGERGADHRRGPGGQGRRGRPPCGAAPSSPAPPPTPSRAWSARGSSCCRRPRRPPACPSSPRS